MAAEEDRRTSRIRDQGTENGLFRACMDQIKTAHSTGQALRTAMVAAGLMTDKHCYAELLGQFYVCTAALEQRLSRARTDSTLVARVSALGYAFTGGYERDLAALLGESEWRSIVSSRTSEPAKHYVQYIETASESDLVGAAFILWGPLVIGGGAALKPRVSKTFGMDATNVFASVVGPDRGKRRAEFIAVFDSLFTSKDDPRFADVVSAAGKCMALNVRASAMLPVLNQP